MRVRKTLETWASRLMRPAGEVGAFARWIAPPKVGIDNRPRNFEYAKVVACAKPRRMFIAVRLAGGKPLLRV